MVCIQDVYIIGVKLQERLARNGVVHKPLNKEQFDIAWQGAIADVMNLIYRGQLQLIDPEAAIKYINFAYYPNMKVGEK